MYRIKEPFSVNFEIGYGPDNKFTTIASSIYKDKADEIVVLLNKNLMPINEVLNKIASFYMKKHNNDEKAAEEIVSLRLTKVEVVGPEVHIHAECVGRLIGKRGENIDNLTKYLGCPVKIFESLDSITDQILRKLY